MHFHLYSNREELRENYKLETPEVTGQIPTTLFHPRLSLSNKNPPHSCVAGKSPQEAKESFYQEGIDLGHKNQG